MVFFKFLFLHSCGETEEIHNKLRPVPAESKSTVLTLRESAKRIRV
jgi:hypothetical protein